MYTLQNVIDDGYNLPSFKELSPAEKATQVGAIKYIEHLTNLTKVDPSKCPIEIFLSEQGKLPVVRNKINMVYFSWNETRVKEAFIPAQSVPLDKVFIIEEQIKQGLADMIRLKTDTLIAAEEVVRSRARALDSATSDLFRYKQEIEGFRKMMSDGVHFRPMVEKVLVDPFWSLDNRRRGLVFITQPVSLSYFRADQAVTNTANFGRLSVIVSFNRSRLEVRVDEYSDNLWVDGFIHPHVDTEGSICFGNAKPAAVSAAAKLDLPALMSVVKDVLTTYNDDNPYRSLYHWDRASDEYNATDSPFDHEEEEEHNEDYDRD